MQEKDTYTKEHLFKYNVTCMGGTFDHMHLGHRLLLSQAVILTKDTLHCGVTSDVLLAKKAYKEFMEPLETRMRNVKDFLQALNPRLTVNVFELTDMAGVGGVLPEVEACILTRETEKGGEILNNIRRERGLKEAELVFVDMIMADIDNEGTVESEKFSNKSSSTLIRKYLAEH